MAWTVRFFALFEEEFQGLQKAVREELLARALLLEQYGPGLGRPWVDTLNGSEYPNTKELRFDADGGVWRVAFAFDPKRQAILLVAGDRSGGSQRKFYKALLKSADGRYAQHLKFLQGAAKRKGG